MHQLRAFALCAAALCGCASPGPADRGRPSLSSRAVATAAAPQERPARRVAIHVQAAASVNPDREGRALSVVLRIFQLRSASQFTRATYDSLAAAKPANPADYAQDVISVREIVLTPAQTARTAETLSPEATHVGVVALLRSPRGGRWRVVVDADAAAARGMAVELHGCTLALAGVAPAPPPDAACR